MSTTTAPAPTARKPFRASTTIAKGQTLTPGPRKPDPGALRRCAALCPKNFLTKPELAAVREHSKHVSDLWIEQAASGPEAYRVARAKFAQGLGPEPAPLETFSLRRLANVNARMAADLKTNELLQPIIARMLNAMLEYHRDRASVEQSEAETLNVIQEPSPILVAIECSVELAEKMQAKQFRGDPVRILRELGFEL